MRSRFAPWLVVLTLAAAGAAAAAGYGLTAPKRYRATAQLLVAPVSPGDSTFAGIGVLRDTGGKRTAAADVAALLRTPQVADAVAAQLSLKRSHASLLHAVHAHVVGSSDVVAVAAEDTSAVGAARLANTFANAFITQRSATFQSELAAAIRRDEQLLGGVSPARLSTGDGAAIAQRLTTLRGFQGQQDPTVQLAAQAAAPTSAAWPSLTRLIGIGAGIGAAVGVLLALLAIAIRGGPRAGAGKYDRPVSDRALEKLVDQLEARLVARESALAARERDLRAALDELRAAQAESAAQAEPAAVDDSDLERREQELGEWVAAVTSREHDLGDRIAAVTSREVELARRAAALALRERGLTLREQELEARPEPEPEPAPAIPAGREGYYNLLTLERLAEQHAPEFPERVEEWTSYLFFLRDYASPDGAVPARFDALISETFGELV
jgi:capsular polysaccharide biosynthesis protein